MLTTSAFANTITCESVVENIKLTQVNDSEVYFEGEQESFFAILAVRTGLSKGFWTGHYIGTRSFDVVELDGLKVIEGNLTYNCH